MIQYYYKLNNKRWLMNNNQANNQVNMNMMPANNAVPTNQNTVGVAAPNAQAQAVKTDFSNNKDAKKVKMIRYKYKVKDAEGKIIESYFDAENKTDVESFLINKSSFGPIFGVGDLYLMNNLKEGKSVADRGCNFFYEGKVELVEEKGNTVYIGYPRDSQGLTALFEVSELEVYKVIY